MVNFNKISKKWQTKWKNAKIFEIKENPSKKKYTIIEMFPYPSSFGLHMGHAFNYTIGDIYARFKRMCGFNVLYPMGYDSLGLPAENAAIKAGTHPKKYTEKSIKNFIKQQKELGLSYDWSRVVMTHDPSFYKWDQWIFLKMYEKGLAYRKKAPVNWCPKCNTVLANEQVHNGKCWRHIDTEVEIKYLEQWFFKITDYAEELYDKIDSLKNWADDVKAMQRNWIGKSHGVEINFEINKKKWKIFTTRPDTIYGVTFMVISAQHPDLMSIVTEEQKKKVEEFLKKIKSTSEKDADILEKDGVFTGSYAVNPLTKEKVPVYAGNFVVAEYGSGMVMAVPAHDQRDFEFAKKYRIDIRQVIAKKDRKVRTVIWSINKSNQNLDKIGLKVIEVREQKINGKINFVKKIEFDESLLSVFEKFVSKNLAPYYWCEYVCSKGIFFIFKDSKRKIEKLELTPFTEEKINHLMAECFAEKPLEKVDKMNVWKFLANAENKWYRDLIIHTGEGILVNSGQFSNLNSKKAIEKIAEYLKKKKLGRKTVQYKLKDWLVSRQRYWGTPIPVVYCDKCGIVPIHEKDLPVKLPENVKFGKGNPLETNKSFVDVKCPKCKGKARRETDTMDTFVNSSWYFLRYTDAKNKKKIFDKKKADYWMPIDIYIGGKEHACMHLIYFRFYTKFLRDIGLLKIDEPTTNQFNQGMLHGPDGAVMSKSRGNIVLPEEVSGKYGIDTVRLFLVSLASPDKDVVWSDKGIQGSLRFIKKVIDYVGKVKVGKSSARIESKVNKTIKEVSEDIDKLRYNLAIIKLRSLFDSFGEEIGKKDLESFLKLLHPFCPHVTEELWEKIGKKSFLSLEKWPFADEKKINKKFEKEDKAIEKLKDDINNIKKITGKKDGKVYVYVIPKDLELYKIIDGVKIFAVNDKNIYDPQGKAKKAKIGRPSIYLE